MKIDASLPSITPYPKPLLLASGNEHTIKSGRADKEYDKIVAKFGKAPAEVAQQQESVEKRLVAKSESPSRRPLP
jgi:hypothetical protein